MKFITIFKMLVEKFVASVCDYDNRGFVDNLESFLNVSSPKFQEVFDDVSFQSPVLRNLFLKYSEGFEKIRQFNLFLIIRNIVIDVNCDVHSLVSLHPLFKDVSEFPEVHSPLDELSFPLFACFIFHCEARLLCKSIQITQFLQSSKPLETLPFTVLTSQHRIKY